METTPPAVANQHDGDEQPLVASDGSERVARVPSAESERRGIAQPSTGAIAGGASATNCMDFTSSAMTNDP
jgi:hypothetical protein